MPDISRIKLPSGNYYDIKDAVAREMISGGVSFIIGWDGTAAPDATKIPAGIKVTYNSTEYTGSLATTAAQAGAFYLVKSSTQAGVKDAYDEYVVVKPDTSDSTTWYWEKIGDTQIDLTDVVTDVSLSKQTDTVIGTDATFTITQPTITLAEDSSTGVTFVRGGTTKYMKAIASGTAVTPTTTEIKATASGGGAAWNSKDQKTVVTGYTIASTNKDTFVKSVSAETNKNLVTTSITPVNGTESVSKVSKTASKLVTTTVPNVTANTDVTASKISSNSSITANKSTWTFTMGTASGETETLIIGGGNGSDVTATNTAYSDVTASKTTLGTAKTVATGSLSSSGTGDDVNAAISISDKTVAKAGTAVTVATGETDENGTGDPVVTGVTIGDSAQAIISLPSPSTATVIGSSSTFTNTQPTVKLTSGATAVSGTTVNVMTGVASVTQPNITLSHNGVSGTDLQYVESLDTSKKMKGTASGANTAWNNKDSVTVLKSTTDVSVTKGNQ